MKPEQCQIIEKSELLEIHRYIVYTSICNKIIYIITLLYHYKLLLLIINV